MKIHTSLRVLASSLLITLSACSEVPAQTQAASEVQSNVSSVQTSSSPLQAADSKIAKAISSKLESSYAEQKLRVSAVNRTPIDNLYEVILGDKQIVYTDPTGAYLITGEIIDTSQGTSLTEARQQELNAISWDQLPMDKAIKEVRGNGALKVAVFSDPDCPYCRRLEQEFAKMDNITIYTFLMPIAQLHPQAYEKSIQIWCQANPTEAWTKWMREGKKPATVAKCAHPVDDILAIAQDHQFNGTPTLVFPNGKVQPGFSPQPYLEELIKNNQK